MTPNATSGPATGLTQAQLSHTPVHEGDGYYWGGDWIITIEGLALNLGSTKKAEKLGQKIVAALNAPQPCALATDYEVRWRGHRHKWSAMSGETVLRDGMESREEAEMFIRSQIEAAQPAAPASVSPSPPPTDLAEENRRLREALINLNAKIDAYWNDPTRASLLPQEAHFKAICAAQQQCRTALGDKQ